jgi:hypothetical protein
MPTPWFIVVRVASISLTRNMYHPVSYRPYRSPSPFSTWGAGSSRFIQKVKGIFTHIFVAVDKFTKWIEAKLTAFITIAKAMQFIFETCTGSASPTT